MLFYKRPACFQFFFSLSEQTSAILLKSRFRPQLVQNEISSLTTFVIEVLKPYSAVATDQVLLPM